MAEIVYSIGALYLAIGCAAAVAFLLFGLDHVDPAARGAVPFRVLLVPGLVLLWPLVVQRWRARLGVSSSA